MSPYPNFTDEEIQAGMRSDPLRDQHLGDDELNAAEQHQDMEDKRHALHDAWKRIKSGTYSMTDVDIVDGAIRELL